MLFEGIVQVSD